MDEMKELIRLRQRWEDDRTARDIGRGRTVGVFQEETPTTTTVTNKQQQEAEVAIKTAKQRCIVGAHPA